MHKHISVRLENIGAIHPVHQNRVRVMAGLIANLADRARRPEPPVAAPRPKKPEPPVPGPRPERPEPPRPESVGPEDIEVVEGFARILDLYDRAQATWNLIQAVVDVNDDSEFKPETATKSGYSRSALSDAEAEHSKNIAALNQVAQSLNISNDSIRKLTSDFGELCELGNRDARAYSARINELLSLSRMTQTDWDKLEFAIRVCLESYQFVKAVKACDAEAADREISAGRVESRHNRGTIARIASGIRKATVSAAAAVNIKIGDKGKALAAVKRAQAAIDLLNGYLYVMPYTPLTGLTFNGFITSFEGDPEEWQQGHKAGSVRRFLSLHGALIVKIAEAIQEINLAITALNTTEYMKGKFKRQGIAPFVFELSGPEIKFVSELVKKRPQHAQKLEGPGIEHVPSPERDGRRQSVVDPLTAEIERDFPQKEGSYGSVVAVVRRDITFEEAGRIQAAKTKALSEAKTYPEVAAASFQGGIDEFIHHYINHQRGIQALATYCDLLEYLLGRSHDAMQHFFSTDPELKNPENQTTFAALFEVEFNLGQGAIQNRLTADTDYSLFIGDQADIRGIIRNLRLIIAQFPIQPINSQDTLEAVLALPEIERCFLSFKQIPDLLKQLARNPFLYRLSFTMGERLPEHTATFAECFARMYSLYKSEMKRRSSQDQQAGAGAVPVALAAAAAAGAGVEEVVMVDGVRIPRQRFIEGLQNNGDEWEGLFGLDQAFGTHLIAGLQAGGMPFFHGLFTQYGIENPFEEVESGTGR